MTDWEKELAKIDKQLASLPEDGPKGRATAPAAPSARGGAVARPTGSPVSPAEVRAATWGVALRLGLSSALAVAMAFWPYEARCGAGLAAYLASVVVVAAGGIWSAVWSWRHRAGRSHVLALLLILWGMVLGSLEVLPRLGYNKPGTAAVPTWVCQ